MFMNVSLQTVSGLPLMFILMAFVWLLNLPVVMLNGNHNIGACVIEKCSNFVYPFWPNSLAYDKHTFQHG